MIIRDKTTGLPITYIRKRDESNEKNDSKNLQHLESNQYYAYKNILESCATQVRNFIYDVKVADLIEFHDEVSKSSFNDGNFVGSGKVDVDSDYFEALESIKELHVLYKGYVFEIAAKEERLQDIIFGIIQDALRFYVQMKINNQMDELEFVVIDATKISYINKKGEEIK